MTDHSVILILCLGFGVMFALHAIIAKNMITQCKWQQTQDKAIIDLFNEIAKLMKNEISKLESKK